jgi:YD repeat-containing protein
VPARLEISLYHAGNLAIDTDPNSGVTEYSYNVNGKLAKIKDVKADEKAYEYDAYGNCTITDANFANPRNSSNYDNNYSFIGRRIDILDFSSLKI